MIGNEIEKIIEQSVQNFDGSYTLNNPFEKLMSFGELVDRLSIVNFKLFTLKNEVMKRENDSEFRAWASVEDVKLVEERARLKRCIDEKLGIVVKRCIETKDSGFNPETKLYQ